MSHKHTAYPTGMSNGLLWRILANSLPRRSGGHVTKIQPRIAERNKKYTHESRK